MLVDKQNELMSDLLFTVHQHGGDDVTWKPPIIFFLEVSRFLIVNFFDYIFSPLLWWHLHLQSALRPSKLLQGILHGLDNEIHTVECSNQLLHTETQLK